MAQATTRSAGEYIFRQLLLWFVIKSAVLSGIGIGFTSIAVWLDQSWWLIGTLIVAVYGVLLAYQYSTHAVIVRSANLIIRRGILRVREVTIPLWNVHLETRQSLPGRMLDYGSVILHLEAGAIEIHGIASIRQLKAIVDRRQAALLCPAVNHWTVVGR